MMGGVFRDVVIAWEGVDYTFTPSNRLLRSIEGQGVNIAKLLQGLGSGDVIVSHLAYVAAAFLRAGGAQVTEDQTYRALMTGKTGEISALAEAVAAAIVPQGPDEKKPAAPAAMTSRARAKTPRKPKA
jgi:hypothetical protein